jgi:hypothetical protein
MVHLVGHVRMNAPKEQKQHRKPNFLYQKCKEY